ncbi:MAG: sulfurtransferase [Firmicutes bacterium]|nr:sulfurtransferase [Bacillota bacterium]
MGDYVLFLVAIIVLVFVFGRRILIMMNSNVKNVSADEAAVLLRNNKDTVILDVRTKEEYDRGHIPGAILIPTQELSARIHEIKKADSVPILVYCASGGRSPGAVDTLLRNKVTNIYHLYRGISSWKFALTR